MVILPSTRGIIFTLLWMMVNGSTFTWSHENIRLFDADIVFKANESSVVQIQVSDPLAKLTVCFWLKLDPLPWPMGSLVFFNYSTYKKDEVVIEYQDTIQFAVGENIILISNSFPHLDFLDDGKWKFICVQWENKNGMTSLYINGNMVANETNKQKNYELGNGGVRLELGYSSAQDLDGRMTCVNVWDVLLSTDRILRLYRAHDCGNNLRDPIIGWQDISTKLRDTGSALLVTPSELNNEQVIPTTTCNKPHLLHGQIYPERSITGHVISTREVLSELQCQDYCLRAEGCDAFNIKQQGTIAKKTCQLISGVTGVSRNSFYGYGRIFDRGSMQKALLEPCSETKEKTVPNIPT